MEFSPVWFCMLSSSDWFESSAVEFIGVLQKISFLEETVHLQVSFTVSLSVFKHQKLFSTFLLLTFEENETNKKELEIKL
jgi:hypothetical protein